MVFVVVVTVGHNFAGAIYCQRLIMEMMMQQKNKRAIFVVEEGEGIARPLYRGKIPASGLTQIGWSAKSVPVLYEQESHTWNGYEPGETIRGLTPKFIVAHTLLSPASGTKPNQPLELSWEPQKPVVESAREHGQFWMFDLDDNVWELPEWNPAYGKPYGISAHLKEWTEDFNSANALIVSTNQIAESARENGVTVPIYVAKNCIKVPEWKNRSDHDPLRVGYIGLLDFRAPDFEFIVEDLRKALEGKRDLVEFWHIGANLEPETRKIRDILRPFPVDIVERPWVSPHLFQTALRELDIALLPAVVCKFNDGRSNVVGLECMAAGVPFLASPIAEYKVLGQSTTNWCKHLKWFIEDDEWRDTWREMAYGNLVDNYTVKHCGQRFEEIFEEVADNA
jgi:hypothetical protein